MSRQRAATAILAITIALAVGGCNETGGAPGPETSIAASPAANGLPPGAACSGEINRYQGVVADDLRTGNVEQAVFDQIQRELGRAKAACAAGRSGEAHAIVAASKSKHGYRA